MDHLIRNLGLVEEALSGLELVRFVEGQNDFLVVLEIAFDGRHEGGDAIPGRDDAPNREKGVGGVSCKLQSVEDFPVVFESFGKLHVFLKMRGNKPLKLQFRKIGMSLICQKIGC